MKKNNISTPAMSINPGARAIARVLDGEAIADLTTVPEPARSIVRRIQERNGRSALDELEAALRQLDKKDANRWRADILAATRQQLDAEVVDAPEPEAPSDRPLTEAVAVPELPAPARLPARLTAHLDQAGAWLTEYVRAATAASPMSPPEHHECLGLILAATAIARRVYVAPGFQPIFPNLFALLIASSGDSKSTGTGYGLRLLELAGLSPLTMPDYMSPQGLLTELIGPKDLPNAPDDRALADWRTRKAFAAQRVLILEEAGDLFDWFGQDSMRGLKRLFLRLYDCRDKADETTVSRGAGVARNLYFTFCGVSTPTDLSPFIRQSVHWGNGIWARFAFVLPAWEKPPYVFWKKNADQAVAMPLVAHINQLAFKRLPQPTENKPAAALEAETAAGVLEMWEAYDRAVRYDLVYSDQLSNRYKSSYKRLPTMAAKIATILATLDWASDTRRATPIIRKEHWSRAQAITEAWRANLHHLLEVPNHDGEDDDPETKLLRRLPSNASGEVETEREIAIRLHLTSPEDRARLSALLIHLQKDGLIVAKQRASGKRPMGYSLA